MTEREHVVIYHADCTDGFTAAWVAHKYWPDATFVEARYGDAPPEVTGKDVLVLDFSYDRATVRELVQKAHSFWLLDHHQTSAQELQHEAYCVIDQAHSGAALAWVHLISNNLPELVRYVEDRDLWKWALPNSRAVSAAIQSYPHTFAQWDTLEHQSAAALAHDGVAILRYQERLIERILKDSYVGSIAGHSVRIANTSVLQSEVCNELAKHNWFAAAYFYQDGQWKFSLRSTENGADVAEIAQMYGGGGHKHSAGFALDAHGEPIRRIR